MQLMSVNKQQQQQEQQQEQQEQEQTPNLADSLNSARGILPWCVGKAGLEATGAGADVSLEE